MKNAMKMTDREYNDACRKMTGAEYDHECNRTYRVTDYQVSEIDEHGDIIDTSLWDTLAEAEVAFDRTELTDEIVAVEIEKRLNIYRGVDRNLEDQKHTTIKRKGEPE